MNKDAVSMNAIIASSVSCPKDMDSCEVRSLLNRPRKEQKRGYIYVCMYVCVYMCVYQCVCVCVNKMSLSKTDILQSARLHFMNSCQYVRLRSPEGECLPEEKLSRGRDFA